MWTTASLPVNHDSKRLTPSQACSSCLANGFAAWLSQGQHAGSGGGDPAEVLVAQGLEQRALGNGLPMPAAWLPQVAGHVGRLAAAGLDTDSGGQ
jgi:hypothetical protein